MLGAILGDIIGSPYEFSRNNIKTTEFPLFCSASRCTDDTVMTLAVAEGLMNCGSDEAAVKEELVAAMQKYGKMYPRVGYGLKFSLWLGSRNPKPYGSYGNGSAMRVSSVAWLYDDPETVERFAQYSAEVTHNHPEGIKGAQATAAAIFMARTGESHEAIKRSIEKRYGYDLSRTPDMIRPYYDHVESCQETVPEAIIAFLHSSGFEDAIRIAVSLGGDSDTVAAITGSIAEGAYGVPEDLKQEALSRLDAPLLVIYRRFAEKVLGRNDCLSSAPSRDGPSMEDMSPDASCPMPFDCLETELSTAEEATSDASLFDEDFELPALLSKAVDEVKVSEFIWKDKEGFPYRVRIEAPYCILEPITEPNAKHGKKPCKILKFSPRKAPD